jgi:hypothetical protein
MTGPGNTKPANRQRDSWNAATVALGQTEVLLPSARRQI